MSDEFELETHSQIEARKIMISDNMDRTNARLDAVIEHLKKIADFTGCNLGILQSLERLEKVVTTQTTILNNIQQNTSKLEEAANAHSEGKGGTVGKSLFAQSGVSEVSLGNDRSVQDNEKKRLIRIDFKDSKIIETENDLHIYIWRCDACDFINACRQVHCDWLAECQDCRNRTIRVPSIY